MQRLLLTILTLLLAWTIKAQTNNLTLKQQQEDFNIFKGALQEGHAGLYYYIDKPTFENECDSIQKTFKEGLSVEDYYLKLRFIITTLHHGHTRISLPTNGNVNYKMAVLDNSKLYLPFQFLIQKDKLIVLEDCSKEQLIPKYSVVKSINEVSSKDLIKKMLLYMPADGINQTFKYYSLYNYFYFHYLFNLFYPDKKGVRFEIENNETHFYLQLLSPNTIDSIYTAKNEKSISKYDKPLAYKSNITDEIAYLRVTSFFKGFIENFKQNYEPFLDSCFTNIKQKGKGKLIIDLRNNEGGGDNYENILFSYLNEEPFTTNDNVSVAGRTFKFKQYAGNSSDGVKMFMENTSEFLRNDTTLFIKPEYAEQMNFTPKKNLFVGEIYVLTNGGTFSAATNFVRLLYNRRMKSPRVIRFIGEEQGGDIYSQAECSGQSYIIDLPNSKIKVDMPALCGGQLNKMYPKKLLPDFEVYESVKSLATDRDDVLQFTIDNIDKISKPLVKPQRITKQ